MALSLLLARTAVLGRGAEERGPARSRSVALGRPHPRDVIVDVLREHIHRHIAAEDDRVVEGLQVVFRSKLGFGLVAEAIDGGVPDLVAARLPWPAAVTVDL